MSDNIKILIDNSDKIHLHAFWVIDLFLVAYK